MSLAPYAQEVDSSRLPDADMITKSPLTAILALGLIAGAVVGTKVTLDAMLGLSETVSGRLLGGLLP